MPGPAATIAIPVYNSAPTLARCLGSASAQSVREIEILVADDGSTDASAEVARAHAARDPRIRLIDMGRNGGKSRAMNRMAEEARGAWFAVLDADDAYRPERLARLIAAAEASGTEMAADNITYIDGGADLALRTAFDPALPARTVGKADLAAHSSSFAAFDFGILKPMIRRDFLQRHSLRYHEDATLSEDFYYLMKFFVAGGRGRVIGEPLYDWTMPFGAVSRRWTSTGNGAWRYDYRNALRSNRHFMDEMQRAGETEMVEMLRARGRQYTGMVHYMDAQRAASERRFATALGGIAAHPSTWRLLATRVAGRGAVALRGALGGGRAAVAQGSTR